MKDKLFHFLFIFGIILLSSYKDVIFMDLEFSSLKDLYLRVDPALTAKRLEMERKGYKNIKNTDIWKYLVEAKWKNGKDLMLSDIVDDILNTECSLIDNYIKDNSLDDNNI